MHKRIDFFSVYNAIGTTASITGITLLWLRNSVEINFLKTSYIIVSVIIGLGTLSFSYFLIQIAWKTTNNWWTKNSRKAGNETLLPISLKVCFITLIIPLILLFTIFVGTAFIRIINTGIHYLVNLNSMTIKAPEKKQ